MEDGDAKTLEPTLSAHGGGADLVGEELEGDVGGFGVDAGRAKGVESRELATTSLERNVGVDRERFESGDGAVWCGDVRIDDIEDCLYR